VDDDFDCRILFVVVVWGPVSRRRNSHELMLFRYFQGGSANKSACELWNSEADRQRLQVIDFTMDC
jgi:hypothetical protein